MGKVLEHNDTMGYPTYLCSNKTRKDQFFTCATHQMCTAEELVGKQYVGLSTRTGDLTLRRQPQRTGQTRHVGASSRKHITTTMACLLHYALRRV